MWFSVRNPYFQIASFSYAEYQQYSSNIEYITVEYLWLTSISRIITVQWLQCIRQYVQRLGTKDDVTDYLSSNKFNCSIVLKEVFLGFFFRKTPRNFQDFSVNKNTKWYVIFNSLYRWNFFNSQEQTNGCLLHKLFYQLLMKRHVIY